MMYFCIEIASTGSTEIDLDLFAYKENQRCGQSTYTPEQVDSHELLKVLLYRDIQFDSEPITDINTLKKETDRRSNSSTAISGKLEYYDELFTGICPDLVFLSTKNNSSTRPRWFGLTTASPATESAARTITSYTPTAAAAAPVVAIALRTLCPATPSGFGMIWLKSIYSSTRSSDNAIL
jgi:hypothetical protein